MGAKVGARVGASPWPPDPPSLQPELPAPDDLMGPGEDSFFFFLNIFYLFIYLFRQRRREGEREAEKHQRVVASCMPAPTGDLTWPTTQTRALTGNPTSDPLVHRPALNSLSHTSPGMGRTILGQTPHFAHPQPRTHRDQTFLQDVPVSFENKML